MHGFDKALPLLCLLASCRAGEGGDSSRPTRETAETGQPDTALPPVDGPLFVLAGGGSEGDDGDAEAWSARLYGALLTHGDVTGDGRVQVAILSTAEETDWLPSYFRWLGADDAFNLQVSTREAAGDTALRTSLGVADVVFLKGGDQGEYYDLWNDSLVETLLVDLVSNGGAVGGTSAGAMSLAEYALAGGQDYVSLDVLEDACTSYLDDLDGGSGIHADFLGFLPGTVVDTHYVARARMGRLVGAMARAADDLSLETVLGIGLDERTGIVVEGDRIQVVGDGSVSFLWPELDAGLLRTCGAPLVWTDLRLDRLTDGWTWDLAARTAEPGSADAEAVAWEGPWEEPTPGDWWVDGDDRGDEEAFDFVVERDPEPYATREGTADPVLPGTTGVVNAHGEYGRAQADEGVFRALHDHVGATGFLVAEGGTLERGGLLSEVVFLPNVYVDGPEAATLVVDASRVTWRSLSPAVSAWDVGDGSLHAAGLAGLRLHVMASSGTTGLGYDVVSHLVTAW